MAASNQEYALNEAVDYHHGRFPPTALDYSRLVFPLGRATAAIARFDAMLAGLHNKELLLAPLRRQEAVISSRIEGTIATLGEVLTFEAEDTDDGDPQERDARRQEVVEVFSYVRALNHAQEMLKGGLPICGRVIRETHKRMLFFGRGANKQPGSFKANDNYIADQYSRKVLFVPISADDLEAGIDRLEKYINTVGIDPLLQTAISHVEFEALHPFNDGNGRLGRMLITLMLWNKGCISGPYLYISSHLEENKDEYIARMRSVSSNDDWTGWCSFFLGAIEAQANHNLKIAQSIVALYEDMKEQFRCLLSSQWAIPALDYIFSRPVFRNSAFTSSSGIPPATAARFSKVLAQAGLLTVAVAPRGRRSGYYAFEPLLKIVRG